MILRLIKFYTPLQQVTSADNPHSFLTSPVIESSVREMIEIAKTRELIWKEISIILTYLAAQIIYLNGQRPGVVQKMTIDEWRSRQEEDGEYVINVMEHKTTGAFGPAKIVVSRKVSEVMEAYLLYVREKITPQNRVFEKRFFLTNTGNEFSKISERMKYVAESFGLVVPKSGVQRKVVATEAFKSEDNVSVRKVQKHMCHSATTCEKFYQQMDNDAAVTSKRTIEKLIKGRHFTERESNAVFREYPLTEDTTPSLGICDKIVQKYNMNKTKKQLQDHWRAQKKQQK